MDNIDTLLTTQRSFSKVEKPPSSVGPRCQFTMRSMFRAFCLKHLIEEGTNTGLRERLSETPEYLEICGLPRVPSYATFSRGFAALANVFGEQTTLDEIVAELVNKLRDLTLDHGFGEGFAIDSTDIEAWETPKHRRNEDDDDCGSDAPRPEWGYRTPKGKRKSSGKSRGKRKRGKSGKRSESRDKSAKDGESFFGYQVQSMSDAVLGIPVVFEFMPANESDNPQFIPLMKKAKRLYGWFAPDYVAADKGYDSTDNHWFAYENGIGAVIPLRKTTAADGMYADVFDQSGALTCDDETPMQYIRTEVVDDEVYHLFGCPAEGCELKERGNGAKAYCRFRFWVKVTDENVRVVGGKLARASSEYRRKYKMRPTIERFFSAAKETRLLDTHRYIKPSKVLLHVGIERPDLLGYDADARSGWSHRRHSQDGHTL